MNSGITHDEAVKATNRLLSFYPDIPASDPRAFVAGLVAMFQVFPAAVVNRAIDPIAGIPALLDRLNLARIRGLLDGWLDEHWQDQKRRERPLRLPRPAENPEAKARVEKGLKELAETLRSGIIP